MSEHVIGLAAMGGDSAAVLERIEDCEERGIHAAWLTVGSANLDGVTLMAAAAARTERILLGTCIVPIWGRHPVAAAQQTQVAAHLSGDRFLSASALATSARWERSSAPTTERRSPRCAST